MSYLREVVRKRLYLDPDHDPDTDPTNDPASPNYGAVWTYFRNRFGVGHPTYTIVTDPFGNQTVYEYDPEHKIAPVYMPLAVRVYRGQALFPFGEYGQENGVLVRTHRMQYVGGDGGGPIQSAGWTILNDGSGQARGWRSFEQGQFGHFARTREYDFTAPTDAELMPEAIPEDAPAHRETLRTYDELMDPNSDRWKLWLIHKLDEQVVVDSAGNRLRKTTRTYTDDGRPLLVRRFADPESGQASPQDLLTRFV